MKEIIELIEKLSQEQIKEIIVTWQKAKQILRKHNGGDRNDELINN